MRGKWGRRRLSNRLRLDKGKARQSGRLRGRERIDRRYKAERNLITTLHHSQQIFPFPVCPVNVRSRFRIDNCTFYTLSTVTLRSTAAGNGRHRARGNSGDGRGGGDDFDDGNFRFGFHGDGATGRADFRAESAVGFRIR